MEKTLVYDGFCKVEKNLENGHERVRTTDSVGVLIYNRRTENVIFIQQKRWPMVREDNPEGYITEAPAGRFDYEVGLVDLIINEVLEETGIHITPSQIQILNERTPLAQSAGILTERMYLAFAIVDLEDENDGLGKVFGEGEEKITRLSVPITGLERMVYDDLKTWALVQWFLRELMKLGQGRLLDGEEKLDAECR